MIHHSENFFDFNEMRDRLLHNIKASAKAWIAGACDTFLLHSTSPLSGYKHGRGISFHSSHRGDSKYCMFRGTSRVGMGIAQGRTKATLPLSYQSTPEDAAHIARKNTITFGALIGVVGSIYYSVINSSGPEKEYPDPISDEELVNWSGTHSCLVTSLYQPETQEHVEAIVADANSKRQKIRCIGSGLSPNGIAFEHEGMMSLSLMDKVLAIDKDRMTVTVQSGARVQDVADKIRPQGMTLLNYASIREQTVGGFTQIGAHGTGAAIPSVDDSVIGMKIVTPSKGTLYLSAEENPELFKMAKVGLGCLGVVTELTLQCVPAHKLVEKTFVTTIDSIKKNHTAWLTQNKHLRYMWIPNTDTVVVVQCNPEGSKEASEAIALQQTNVMDERQSQVNPLQELLAVSNILEKSESVDTLSPTECRDALLAHDPLNSSWVAKVNKAEAEFWKRNQGIRVGWSDEILGFDCGGQQWVFEVAFPCGDRSSPNLNDIKYMEDILKLVEKNKIPAPSPIEQRWSSGSSSSMSPCSGSKDALFSWVGIIMYLPEDEDKATIRNDVTKRFMDYKRLVERKMLSKYGAVEHWAKIEIPESPSELKEIRKRLHRRYPIDDFQKARQNVDQNNILGNNIVDSLFYQG